MNGEEALEIVTDDMTKNKNRFSNYGLILMDCNMPFMDGYECTKHIRKLFARKGGMSPEEQPIISAVTAHVEP